MIWLDGDLGAGKTSVARGFLRALGVSGAVRSPTYTLVEYYDCAPPVAHMDLYRLGSPDELEDLGLDDCPPDSHWWLVEWPQRGGDRLPKPDLHLALAIDGSGRRLSLAAHGERGRSIAEELANQL